MSSDKAAMKRSTPPPTLTSPNLDQIIAEKPGYNQSGDDDFVVHSQERKLAHWRLTCFQWLPAPEADYNRFKGSGTQDDPYVIGWHTPYDPLNPMTFSPAKKWLLTILVGISTLAVSFCTTAYSVAIRQIQTDFHVGNEVAVLGLSLFVLGFSFGPLLWAPLSELYGRQLLYGITLGMITVFNAGVAASTNIRTLLVLRFLGGAFGVSVMTNCGGTVADLFSPAERGFAMIVLTVPGIVGPALGPIAAGYLFESAGWRWVEGFCAIFTGLIWITMLCLVPETYGPFILRKRAQQLSLQTGNIYISKMDIGVPKKTLAGSLSFALTRPWLLLAYEPIVLSLSIYLAISYGILYLFFEGFPIVFQEQRHWGSGAGGLAFTGVAVGNLLGCLYAYFDDFRYLRVLRACAGHAPPESRLPTVMVGGLAMPVGIFWFAWTNSADMHWAISIVGSGFFGFGFVLVYLGVLNYLIDSYTIFAASTLAANVVLRYIFGAVFPLFTRYMYDALGIHWASSVPAFLSLVCAPLPFVFYRYGAALRQKCRFAAESARYTQRLLEEEEVL